LGLLPVGLNSNRAALEQTAAASVASAVAVDLRQTPLYSAHALITRTYSPRFQIQVPNTINDPASASLFFTEDGTAGAPNVNADPTQNPPPRYRVTLAFTLPTTPGTDRTATLVRVFVTWPAAADPIATSTPVNFSGSFETVIALDRN
jgi:hypothetical protein